MIARTAIPSARVAVLLSPALLTCILWAQSGPLDQPHVVPRAKPDAVESAASVAVAPLGPRTKPMRVDVDLVLVPVTVTDALSRPVIDLPKQNFMLYEGGVAQPIQYFSHEDAPISVGLILDCSGSMRNKIEYEREAVAEFFKNANPEDEYFAITVSDHPQVIATSEQSVGTIEEKLGITEPSGHTALYDAVYLGVSRMRSAHLLIDVDDSIGGHVGELLRHPARPADLNSLRHSIRAQSEPHQRFARAGVSHGRGGVVVQVAAIRQMYVHGGAQSLAIRAAAVQASASQCAPPPVML